MRFSPNTLNSVIAVLSVDNVTNITPDQLNAALQALLGEQNTSPDLQPGETYLVYDKDNCGVVEFTSRSELDEWLQEAIREDSLNRSYTRDVDSYASVYIVRRELTVEAKLITQVTIS
jgi:MoxR-like ATPase